MVHWFDSASFKAGEKIDPSNYGGITVVVILAKLYAMVLEARASAWAEHWKCRAKGQAGVWKEFRTTGQVFRVQTLTQQTENSKRNLYTCFVDFEKAFHLVPRSTLWKGLEVREGFKVLISLRSRYAADKACVLTKDGPTQVFECGIRVKQGCPASPLLFNLYLDKLEKLLEESATDFDCPMLTGVLLAILLFADEIAIFSYSASGLQEQLGIPNNFLRQAWIDSECKEDKDSGL